ncbi:MAG: hypothetical protein E7Z75_10035 [Methanobrevibacter olleyae]|uniref:Metallo-beta-lactamase domain-containing protein n=1 Tax=Methanobrevibacter olleyae TaxID=294671 RepID=A0A8T3W0G7_METOL|nr:hypothetical protein [Methanobrevibacter olleyae]
MFYIKHGTDNFTIIDCCINENSENILEEIKKIHDEKTITRFILTHPHKDHYTGLTELHETLNILNFYYVKNNIELTESDDSTTFEELKKRDNVCYLKKDLKRRYMNEDGNNIKHSGINILWPDIESEIFKEELEKCENETKTGNINNISPIIKYSLENSITCMWMGDLETEMMEKIYENELVDWPEIDVLFAPHHGRTTGKVPTDILKKTNPKLIVIGEANSENLDYYENYTHITQNSCGNILFNCENNLVEVYVSDGNYAKQFNSYEAETIDEYNEMYKIGEIEV